MSIVREVARTTQPEVAFAIDMADSIQRKLAAALDDGSYDEAVAAMVLEDPDLAS